MNMLSQMADRLDQQGLDLELSLDPELRVPKREVLAEISFTFAPEVLRQCFFYLNYYSPRRQGQESLAEHLNSGQSFYPLRIRDCKEFFIVHIDHIQYVREAVVMELKTGRMLNLHLERGSVLRASLPESRRAWYARPVDILNEPERFVAFVQDDHVRLHVNKRHIARVEGL